MDMRFAFDIGTNSIGSAVWRIGPDPAGIYGDNAPLELLWAGVRLFKDGRNPKDEQSLAAMRRVPRGARKRRDRFVLRRSDLLKTLIETGLLPADPVARKALQTADPMQLRAAALDRPLTQYELGRAIFHLNQRRGFQSNRKTDKGNEDDNGKIARAASALRDKLAEQHCRTFGEFLARRHQNYEPTRIRLDGKGTKALYHFYPLRAMLRDEFNQLWATQSGFSPRHITAELGERIAKILFRQRPLKPQLIGKCTFVPTEERLPKALISVQAREIYERLNHIRVSTNSLEQRKLSVDERDLVASVVLWQPKLTFAKIRKALKFGSNVRINLEESEETELAGLKANAILLKPDHYGPAWRTLSYADKDAFIAKLLAETDDDVLAARLVAEDGLSLTQAFNCTKNHFLPDGYSRFGKTANAKILTALIHETDINGRVVPYNEAVKRAGWHHSDERDGEIFDRLPYYGAVLARHIMPGSSDPADKKDDAAFHGRIANPTVHIGLNQLRRVVNDLIASFGHPKQITVELARELKQTAQQKKEEQDRNRTNKDANRRRDQKLAELGVEANGRNRARLRLYEDQTIGGIVLCPFSGKPISCAQLFSAGSEIEEEHILPRSLTLDDSAANKVLVFRETNRIKRGNAPYKAFGQSPDWEAIAARGAELPRQKRWRFLPDAMDRFSGERDFLARQLNETRYLSRLAKAYLGKICDPDQIYVVPGTLTGMLRGKLELNGLLSDDNHKNRSDHRHHAIDAVLIGAMTRGLLQYLAKSAGRSEAGEFDALLGKVPPPFEGFRDHVRARIDAVIVSNKPERGKAGALHEDTNYGLIDDVAEAAEIGNLVRRKFIRDLTAGEVDAVRDPLIRQELQALTASLRDGKGKIAKADEKAFAAVLDGYATTSGVRRIRVGKVDHSAVKLKDRTTGKIYRAVTPGENHHMDIVQMRDGKWQGFAATVFEVNQRGWRPEWEREKLGGKLVMRVHKGDMLEVDDKDGVRRVKTVVRLNPSGNRLYLVSHNEGGNFTERKKDITDPFDWDLAGISGLKDRNCVAILVDPIGGTRKRRSNV